MKIAIIDYGVGNLRSVSGALAYLGMDAMIVNDRLQLRYADKIILPGVGAFGDAVRSLRQGGWVDAIRDDVLERKKPLLGICVGMQLLATRGTEGDHEDGLDLIPGEVRRLDALGCTLRIPHVGWNAVEPMQAAGPLFAGISPGTLFYFVNSYSFQTCHEENVSATVHYGVPLTAAVSSGSIFGMQFHPEKSSKAGLKILENFSTLPC